MSATWITRLGVKTRIIDKRNTKIFTGQADGLQSRSLKIFNSFGFADRVWKEANHMLEGELTDFIWGVLDIIPIIDFRKSFFYDTCNFMLTDAG